MVFGTRPEAIKMAPVIKRLKAEPKIFRTIVAVTAQHREMLDQVLQTLQIIPDMDLGLMRPGQTLAGLTAQALSRLESVLHRVKPDMVMVQGDTSTTLAAALAAFYQGKAVGHIEAGLRSFDLANPFPEEANRRMVSMIADWHFAATPRAGRNLLNEGIRQERIFVTGNPVVDIMQEVFNPDFAIKDYLSLDPALTSHVVITAHRRESFGQPLIEICSAVAELAEKFPATGFVFSIHRNPRVRCTVYKILKRIPGNLYLVAPLTYEVFINILARSRLALTDSGGIQEEASALGVKTLILRRVTERPEALEAGARLVPLSQKAIVSAVSKELRLPRVKGKRVLCPFGDGHAADRIAQAVAWAWGRRSRRPRPFIPRTVKR